MTGHFRYTKWDPILIISQIVCLQATYYIGLGFCLCCLNIISGNLLSLDSMLNYEAVNLKEGQGRLVATAFTMNAFLTSVALWWVVQRTKLCLDFSCTTLFYHVLFCCLHSSRLPSSASWWLVQTACLSLACVGGEFLCMRTEMVAIPVSLASRADL